MSDAAGAQFLELLSRNERGYRDPAFKPEHAPSFDVSASRVKLVAYYLPQFHPIRENDEWWGKGFTEWTSVTQALPQFPGHYQPHLPSDLGFYDLRLGETLERQVVLARQYGISGFCFYYYWFGGQRLLERPLDVFAARKGIAHDFCLCWANENWTRRWDGAEAEVLMAQVHTPESDLRFIADVLPYMEDPRYIHIDGRPVLIVYRVALLPEPKATAERWRSLAHKHLGKNLFLVYAMTFGTDSHPSRFGFDAAVQFPPHLTSAVSALHRIQPFRQDFNGHVFEYESILSVMREFLARYDFPMIPSVFPCWDNTPRRAHLGSSFIGSTPDLYATWLAEAAYHASRKPVADKCFVTINAWNEWAEGAHLEPDQKFGHAYLRATADVLRPYSIPNNVSLSEKKPVQLTVHQSTPSSRLAVIIHAHYSDILDDLLTAMPAQPAADLFITVSDEGAAKSLSVLAKRGISPQHLSIHPNRGRDVRPFLSTLREVVNLGYPYFMKLHTKRTTHRSDGHAWNAQLTTPLLKALKDRAIVRFFDEHPRVGLIAPFGHVLDGRAFIGSAGNCAWLDRLSEEFDLPEVPTFSFPAGNMFAGRTADLAALAKSETLPTWFEDEEQRRDGTLAHALERFVGVYLAARGQSIASIRDGDSGLEFSNSVIPEAETYAFAARQSA
jgi:lipopolysaccharide biosynthesis protein